MMDKEKTSEIKELSYNDLNKILKGNKEWMHKHELKKINYFLALITLFIALGEVSMITKNLLENNTKEYYFIYFFLIGIMTLILSIVWVWHSKKLKEHHRNVRNLIEVASEGGQILG